MRPTLILLIAMTFTLAGNYLQQPTALHYEATGPGSPSRILLASTISARTSASLPLAAVQRDSLRPAQSTNPPRAGARHTAHRARQSMLHLPTRLPARTLDVPIMMYHHVSSIAPTTDLNRGLTVTDEAFAAQLDYLRRHNYHTILLPQLFAALYHNAALPPHPIVLTFDDGYLDNYSDALPLLKHYHDRGEFNIISAYVGLTVGINSYMHWPQIKSLVASGMEIGSHTVDHQDLGTLPEDHIRFELRDSRNILQVTLHVPVQFLAYPSGEPFRSGTLDAQQRVLALLPAYGYVGAVLDGPLTTGIQNAQKPFQLERIRVAGGENITEFANSLQS